MFHGRRSSSSESFRSNHTKSRNFEIPFDPVLVVFGLGTLEFIQAGSWFMLIKPMQTAFYQSESEQPHPGRSRLIIKTHPEVRQLMVRNPWTALVAVSIVVMQTAIAFGMGRLGFGYWWLSLLIAYCVGAFANHANYVIIHDATHNLIFRNKSWNKMVAIIADLPNLTPGAMGFRVYHLKHHSHQGDYEYDADLANHWEARW